MSKLIVILIFLLFILQSSLANLRFFPTRNENKIARVAWGTNAAVGEFPHQVALFVRRTKFFFFTVEEQFCGGTIIGPQHILTAAHCLDDVSEPEIFVVAGEVNLQDFRKSPFIQIKDVHAKWVHQNWKGAQSFTPFDVAVLILKSNFTFNQFVQPAALESNDIQTGTPLWVTGWGITEENFDAHSQNLKKIQLPLANSSFCEGFGFAFNRENELCAGNGRYDACSGDSGGPLGRFSPNTNQFTVSGIVSWGPNAKCGTLGSYGAYANVKSFKSWIEPYLNEIYVSGATKTSLETLRIGAAFVALFVISSLLNV